MAISAARTDKGDHHEEPQPFRRSDRAHARGAPQSRPLHEGAVPERYPRAEVASCARLYAAHRTQGEPRVGETRSGLGLGRACCLAARLFRGAPQLFGPRLVLPALGEHFRMAYVGHAFLLKEFSRRTFSEPFQTA